jgi:hemerythrin
MATNFSPPGGIEEDQDHRQFLAWATSQVDRLASERGAADSLCELLDWVAYFTREHFGFQERLLNECSQQREHVINRVAVHLEFRKKLAQLCVDSMRRDPTVSERLRSLCHELLDDTMQQHAVFSDLVGSACGTVGPRLRRKPRQGQLAIDAASMLEAQVRQSASGQSSLRSSAG